MPPSSVAPYLTDIIEAIEHIREKAGATPLEVFKQDWEQQWIVMSPGGVILWSTVCAIEFRLLDDQGHRLARQLGAVMAHVQAGAAQIVRSPNDSARRRKPPPCRRA